MIKNEIIAKINIKKNNSKKRIINSFEDSRRDTPYLDYVETKENEEEIKDCEIYQ